MVAEQFNTNFSITDKKTHMQRVNYVSKQMEELHTCYTYLDKPSYKLVSIYESNDSWVFWLKDKELVVLPKCVGINSFITAMGVMEQNAIFVKTFKDTYTMFGNCSIESYDCESGLVFLNETFGVKENKLKTPKSLEKEILTLKNIYLINTSIFGIRWYLLETDNCWIFETGDSKTIVYKTIENAIRVGRLPKTDVSEYRPKGGITNKEFCIKNFYERNHLWENAEYHDDMSSEKFLNTEFPESRI